MPFLWKKKSRVARISQRFVADLQSPRKHGGSLVVETGFPTSLVDLFIKNKNRLRKPSSKRKQDEDQDCWEISEPVLTSPLPPHLVCPEACADLVKFELRGGGCSDGGIEVAEEFVRTSEAVDVTESGEDSGSSRNGAIVNVSKVFVALVLGLSSRRFASGVTLSAVLILFLELIGTWVFGSGMPLINRVLGCRVGARAGFEPLINRVCDFFGITCLLGEKSEEGKSLDAADDGVSLKSETDTERDVEFYDCSLVVKKTGETDGAVRAGEELIIRADPDLVDHQRRWDYLGSWSEMRYAGSKIDEYLDLVSECEDHKHDQYVKPRSKFMQRIVPKKLKRPKAWRRNTGVRQQVVEDNYEKVKEEVEVPIAKEQLVKWCGDKKTNDEKMTNDGGVKIVDEVIVVAKTVDGGREGKQRMALMITFTMILAALIGGRFLAFMLTTGYLGSKFIGAMVT